jgi:DNA repair exonuclease SbcCD nuclease subunit
MILFLTDLHWGIKKFSKDQYNLQMNYFREVIFPFVLENKIEHVIHAGDIVDEPQIVDNAMLQDLQSDWIEWFENHRINLYLMCGNHDIYLRDETTYNFNKILSHGRKYVAEISDIAIRYIDNTHIGFVPFSKSFDELKRQSSVLSKYDFGNMVVVGHHDIKDITFNRYGTAKKGLDSESIKDFGTVVVGHYHNQSQTRNIRYLGTLYQHTAGEFGFRKGFWTMNSAGEFSFHEQTTLPRHYEIEYIQEGRKQPTFVINDGIEVSTTTNDYNVVRKIVSKNHTMFTATNYNTETKYQEIVNDLKSIAYSEFVPVSKKNLVKSIEAHMEIAEDDAELGLSVDSDNKELILAYFSRLPDTLAYKQEMINVINEKLETVEC